MLALFSPAGHSERSLTTTYETIPYHLHRSSSPLWLDDILRQQEGIDDDNLDVELNRGDHEEGYGHKEGRHHEEGAGDHQEDHQKENGRRRFSSGVTVAYSVTVRFAALRRRAHTFGESAPDRLVPSPNRTGLVP